MRRLSNRNRRQITYLAAAWPTGARGNAKPSYPPTGPLLWASVQRDTITRMAEDGSVLSVSVINVYLLDDPTSLNGGSGIQERDSFLDRGRTLVAIGPPRPPVLNGGTWKVECNDVG